MAFQEENFNDTGEFLEKNRDNWLQGAIMAWKLLYAVQSCVETGRNRQRSTFWPVIMKSFSQNPEARQWQFLHRKRREMLFANPDASEAPTADYQVGYGRISLMPQGIRSLKTAQGRADAAPAKGEGLYLVKLRLRLSESRWSRFFGRSEHHRPAVTSTSPKPS